MILWLAKLIWQNYSPRGRWNQEYIQHVDYVKHVGREYLRAKMSRNPEVREMRTLFLAALLQGIRITHELRRGPSSPTLDRWIAIHEVPDTMNRPRENVELRVTGDAYPLSIFNGQKVPYKVACEVFADVPPHKWDAKYAKVWNQIPSCNTIKIVVEPN